MGEAESELLRNSELGIGAPGRAVTFPRSHSSEQGGGQTWAGAAHTGPSHCQPPAPHPPAGPDVQFDVTTYRPTLSLPTALPLTVILLAPEVGGGGVGL